MNHYLFVITNNLYYKENQPLMSTKSQNLQIFITNCKKFLKIEQPVKEIPVIEFSKEKERHCQKRQCLSNLHSCLIHNDMIKLDMPY